MRLESINRVAPSAFVMLLLTAHLGCSSSSSDTNSPVTAGAPGSSGGASGGSTAAGAANVAGGDDGGSSTAGSVAGGGALNRAGSGGASSNAGGGGVSGGGVSGADPSSGSAAGASATGGGSAVCPTLSELTTWPSGKGPLEIGKLAVTNFKGHTGDSYSSAGYAWAFAYTGALQFTKITNDTAGNATLISGFERYASGGTAAPNNQTDPSVDQRAFGVLPLEIFIENQDTRCLTLGLAPADAQLSATTPDGITKDARYWADDMFMITGLQVYASRASNTPKYLAQAALIMKAYLSALQHPDGLFQHTKTSKAYWGRANGWVAAGMAELLLDLPAGADRDTIMAGYKKQMDGLLPLQIKAGGTTPTKDVGMWRQVLDTTANPESSCTAMFTFALTIGVRNGWLTDAKYVTAARNGWLALGNHTDGSGALDRVCPGTDKAPDGSLESQQAYYANIALGSNDQHGQAPLFWAADALLRADCRGAVAVR